MSGQLKVVPAPLTPDEQLERRGVSFVSSSTDERAELLEHTAWSQRLSWQEIKAISGCLRRYALADGKYLFREGDHDAFAAIVLSGHVEISKRDASEHCLVVSRVGAGKIIGEMSILDGAARSATATARSQTDLLVLGKAEFDALAKDQPGVAFKLALVIATAIAHLLRQTTGALVEHLGET